MTFLILTYILVMAAKKLNFYGEKKRSNFCQKYEIQKDCVLLKQVKS